MGSVGEEDEEESTCLPDDLPRKNNVNRIYRKEGESDFLIMHIINFLTRDESPKDFMIKFMMIAEDSVACYYGPHIDNTFISKYHKIVDEGFSKIQTIKGFTRFCGWLESGRPKTFKLKELEYIALNLKKSERFATWEAVPGRSYTTDITMARDREIFILKNASKKEVEVRCGKSRLYKDEDYLKPQQIAILFGGEVCRIIDFKKKKEEASVCTEKM